MPGDCWVNRSGDRCLVISIIYDKDEEQYEILWDDYWHDAADKNNKFIIARYQASSSIFGGYWVKL